MQTRRKAHHSDLHNFFSYVNPEVDFDPFNTKLTGISAATVKDTPTFEVLWKEIQPMMESGILVAHNAVFDLSVLKACLGAYDITWKKSVRYLCTVQAGRKLLPGMKHNLNILCDYYGIPLDHHKADSDSRACAELLLRYIADGANEKDFKVKDIFLSFPLEESNFHSRLQRPVSYH